MHVQGAEGPIGAEPVGLGTWMVGSPDIWEDISRGGAAH